MAKTFLQYHGEDDLLFPMDGGDQTRYSHMQVITFAGTTAPRRCARFIREYTNRDGTQGLPPAHIGATSPYIDNGMIYFFYHDNANFPFDAADFNNDAGALAAAEVVRLAAVAANVALLDQIQGADVGWQ